MSLWKGKRSIEKLEENSGGGAIPYYEEILSTTSEETICKETTVDLEGYDTFKIEALSPPPDFGGATASAGDAIPSSTSLS